MSGRKYVFCGAGVGVPGLPHEISEEEAKALQVEDSLKAAVALGIYREVKPVRPARGAGEESV